MTQVSFRIDKDVKLNAEKVLNEIGLSMSAAITIFLRKTARERRIPFELNADPFYSEKNQAYLMKSVRELREGKGHPHELLEDGIDD